ncbi:MAG TPA: ECF-type sigma factor [Acidobacteriaceae bacterium]|jgi:RNA polymerase sigma factor (TIGR02999 family)
MSAEEPSHDTSNSPKAQLDAMIPQVYGELHRLAFAYLRSERPGHTLQPTALINEVYLRLTTQHSVDFHNRAHLIGVAAQMMRRILCNYEEQRRADKRGGDATLVYLEDAPEIPSAHTIVFSELDHALNRFAEIDPRQAKVMELRIFGGLNVDETAEFLEISPATVHRDWATGKLWLAQQLRPA